MIAEIAVDIRSSFANRTFDYNIPDALNICVGDRVSVPFGRRNVEGFVVGIKPSSTYDKSKIKDILRRLDDKPLLTKNMLKLCFFMAKKFYLRLIDVIKLCLPPMLTNGKVKARTLDFVSLNLKGNLESVRSSAHKQKEIINYLKENESVDKRKIVSLFGSSALKSLLSKGIVKVEIMHKYRTPKNDFSSPKKEIVLNEEQKKIVECITRSKCRTFLIRGVTGSGKTEVYINCIKNVLKKGKTAIMLVPEISLTPQMFSRFRNAFGDTIAILHSGLSLGERFDEWDRLKTGKAKIALGARSCIFAPLENLGIIIIDEEQDSSYFSESNPRYHTHEVARYLGYLNDCPVILGSATPSVESSYRAQQGEYTLLTLNERANKRPVPQIEIIDMLREIKSGNMGIFSGSLISALKETIDAKKQAMIFINRRGFSSFLMCRNCGYVPKCEDCDVSLVYHKEDNLLKCHYCARRYKVPTSCPKCGSKSLRYGIVGTERVVEELKKLFDVPILRLDNDSTKTRNAHVKILEEFNKTSPAILVGTQMVAKGHDFGNVVLVGIINADLSLHFSDYRAIERTFELITQVAGRAGRSEYEGRVILQTYYPKHFVYRCASNYDYKAFFERELKLRQITHFPPFVYMLRLLVLSQNEERAKGVLYKLFNEVKKLKLEYKRNFIYLGAMACPRRRLQKNYRFEIMIRLGTKNADDIIPKIYEICSKIKAKKVSIFVENDPQNLS